MKSLSLSLAARFLYIASLFPILVQTGHLPLSGIIIFFATTPLYLLAKDDERYYSYDALLITLFTISNVLLIFGIPLVTSIIGLDKVFHIAAGAALCLIIGRYFGTTSLQMRIAVLVMVLVVGIGWEVYEWIDYAFFSPQMALTLLDTALDLVADTIGALFVLAIYR